MLVQPGKMKESLAGEEEVEGSLTCEEALMEKRKQEDEAKKKGQCTLLININIILHSYLTASLPGENTF